MTNDRSLKNLYSAVDQRQMGSAANGIAQRLRSEYDIATGDSTWSSSPRFVGREPEAT